MGRLPATILFQVTQLLIHVVFYSCCYPVIYAAFHVTFSALPLLAYALAFVLLTVYNAAQMDKKWIGKLQRMAVLGMESERIRQSFAVGHDDDGRPDTIPSGGHEGGTDKKHK